MKDTQMEERIARIIRNIGSLDDLARFETNARNRNALTDEVKDAIRARSGDLGRALVLERTGLDLTDLSPAEEKIVEAVSEYVGVQKREGKNANRTLDRLRNRGLIDAAETSVSRSKPTQGFQTLADADLMDLSYEQIVLDHPEEFSPRAIWYARQTLGLPNDSAKPPAKAISPTQTRTEVLLRWLQETSVSNGGRLPSYTNADAAAVLGMMDMHQFGRVFGNIQSRIDYACYVGGLPPLGLAANAPFDNAWDQQDRDWAFPVETMQAAARSRVWSAEDFDLVLRETQRLPGLAHISWKKEIATNEAKVKAWAFGLEGSSIRVASAADAGERGSRHNPASPQDEPYWVFVCNPKKWAIDRFLDRRVEHDTWGVRPSDRDRFAPGQLGIIRVGVDRRTVSERNGNPPLEAGIYALCEVESKAFDGTGASDEFWAPGQAREPGWPTVNLRYLRTYLDNPLTIEKLRAERPEVSELLLNGFQAASFPISAEDFHAVMALLGEDLDDLPSPADQLDVDSDELAALEERYLHASPEVKVRLSRTIERGPIGALVKRATGFKCQLCEALCGIRCDADTDSGARRTAFR
jgi:predicted RNA-binding protein with PUA-like domain